MGRTSIEEKIKNALSGHREPIDKDELWSSLGLEDKKETKRRPIAVWWWSGLLLVSICVTVAILITPSATESTLEPSHKTIELSDGTTPYAHTTEQMDSANQNKSIQSIASTSTTITATTETDSPQPSVNHIAAHSNTTNTPTQHTRYYATTDYKSTKTHTDTPRLTTTIAAQETRPSQASGKPTQITTQTTTPTTTTAETSDGRRLLEQLPYIYPTDVLPMSSRDKRSDLPIVTAVPTDDLSPPMESLAVTDRLQLYTEYGTLSRSLTGTTDQSIATAALRNDNEEALDYYAVGLSYRHMLTDRWSIFTGVEYTQFNEQLLYSEADSSTVAVDVDEVFTDIDGVTTTTTTTAQGLELTERLWTYQNQMRSLQVPIGVGHHLDLGKVKLGMDAGMLVRLSSSLDGHLTDSRASITTSHPQYDRGLGLGMLLGAQISYPLSNKWSISGGLAYRKYFSSYIDPATELDQTYQSLGGRVSLSYRW